MRVHKHNTLVCVLATALFWGCQTNNLIEADWLISGVSVVDSETGEITPNAYVAVVEDSIAGIYVEEVFLRDSTKVIKGEGKFLVSGMWDMHGHVSFNHNYQMGLHVANGVVGVREMWGKMSLIDSIRRETKKGTLIAPEIYTSGSLVDGDPPYWTGSDVVANAAQAGEVLRQQAAQGVDFFKIYSLLSREAYFAIADESKKLGIPFGGHVPESVSLFEAIDAGQVTTEHLMKFIPACSDAEEELVKTPGFSSFIKPKIDLTLETFNQEKYEALVEKLAKGNTWLVPTLIVKQALAYGNDTLMFSIDPKVNPYVQYMPEYTIDLWRMMPIIMSRFGEGFYEANQRRFVKEMSLLGDMQDKGVRFLAGTDYANPHCYPGFTMHDELGMMVKAGFTNLEALQTATYNPAVFFNKQDKMGNVKGGMVADLMLLNGNPLEDISNTKKIEAVFLKGKYFSRAALDDLLEKAKVLASREVNEIVTGGSGMSFPIHIHMGDE